MGLAQRTITFITSFEPFANTSNVEIILAILTTHSWQRFVGWMKYTITNVTLFSSF